MTSLDSDALPAATLPDQVEFIQAISVDINAFAKGKLFPREKLESLLQHKDEVVMLVEVLGVGYEIPMTITELSDAHYENNYIVPDRSTLRVAPWSNDSSVAMFFYDAYNRTTRSPSAFNPRLLAKTKIKDLEQAGFKLFIGVENEFRLFDKFSKKPFIEERGLMSHFHQMTMTLPFFRELRKKLKLIDVEFDSCNIEYGQGQVEVPLKVYGGIDGVDKIWLFKQVSKYVADEMGLIASFMSVPMHDDLASGYHVNQSLWSMVDNKLTNAMWKPEADHELSEIGKYWLGGLIKHAKALSAFYNPTVNCYRRTRAASWAPNLASWNYRDRMVALRVKVSKDNEKLNYIENRLPSSACNIYLVVAATIAAGMDGLKNHYDLPEPGNGPHCELLPRSLEEALQHLREDSIFAESLGEKFIEWYIKIKQETEVDKLKDVDIDIYTEKGIAKEREFYFNF